jgi:hypothetical protein
LFLTVQWPFKKRLFRKLIIPELLFCDIACFGYSRRGVWLCANVILENSNSGIINFPIPELMIRIVVVGALHLCKIKELKALSNEIGFSSHLLLNRKKFPLVFRKVSIVIVVNQTRHIPSSSALIPMSICTLQCLFSHSFTTYE